MPSIASDLHVGGLTSFIDAMTSHDIRLIAGLEPADLADHLSVEGPAWRAVLHFDLDGPASTQRIIEAAIAQLARVVGDLWPFLWNEDFSTLRADALGRAHLPLRLAEIAKRLPGLSQAWAREVALCALLGTTPRLKGAPPALEWSQLVLAFSDAGLTIAMPLGPSDAGDARIRAIEWLAEHADVRIVILAKAVPDGGVFERIVFGARRFVPAPTTGSAAWGPDPRTDQRAADRPIILSLPAAAGRPHPQSAVEMRLYTKIQADPDLRPLFAFNRIVPELVSLQARADVIWAEGRIIVEIDGPEHRGAAKYRADRHRDYRLMCAGYRVLRVTNEDVIADTGLTLEKIRDVVRLAREEKP